MTKYQDYKLIILGQLFPPVGRTEVITLVITSDPYFNELKDLQDTEGNFTRETTAQYVNDFCDLHSFLKPKDFKITSNQLIIDWAVPSSEQEYLEIQNSWSDYLKERAS